MMPTGTQRRLQLLAEIIADGREIGRRFRPGRHPFSFAVVGRLRAGDFFHAELPQVRIGRQGDLRIAAGGRLEHELHVGLAGGQPHVAHQHVGNGDPIPALNQQLKRAGRRVVQVQADRPPAIAAGHGAGRLAGQRDGHLLARRGPAPNGRRRRALQHHVLGEDRRQPHLRATAQAGSKRNNTGRRRRKDFMAGGISTALSQQVLKGLPGWLACCGSSYSASISSMLRRICSPRMRWASCGSPRQTASRMPR